MKYGRGSILASTLVMLCALFSAATASEPLSEESRVAIIEELHGVGCEIRYAPPDRVSCAPVPKDAPKHVISVFVQTTCVVGEVPDAEKESRRRVQYYSDPANCRRVLAMAAQLGEVWEFSLQWMEVNEEWLKAVGELSHLRTVYLLRAPVQDEWLSHLAKLRYLDTVWLSHTKVSNRGVRILLELPELRSLNVRSTRVSTALFQELPKARKLEDVITNVAIDDDGVEALCRLTQLRRLGVDLDSLTDARRTRLLTALPKLDLGP